MSAVHGAVIESSLLQDSGYLSNLLRVKHLCHLPLILLLPDPGLPAGLEATEEGQDLGLDHRKMKNLFV